MELATIIPRYGDALERKYGPQRLPSHHRALPAITHCRTTTAGELVLHCTECHQLDHRPRSCGHRSCPRCQNHEVSVWLDRQREKLLPVDYFRVTFTLPSERRDLAWSHQRLVYDALFEASVETLKSFGLNPKHLGAQLGMTAVLHTNSRRLDYHPHVHVVVPGGGLDPEQRCWKRPRYQYLFNEFALAKVFRAKCLHAIRAAGLTLPGSLPQQWVVDCRCVGQGHQALEYLSRYLYRGVIAEHQIFDHHNGQVSFHYTDSQTGQTQIRTLAGEDFLWLVLQHVLPRGFHRVRDYGFLHHNAKSRLPFVQYLLQVTLRPKKTRLRPSFRCRSCGQPMRVVAVRSPNTYPAHRHDIGPHSLNPPVWLSG